METRIQEPQAQAQAQAQKDAGRLGNMWHAFYNQAN